MTHQSERRRRRESGYICIKSSNCLDDVILHAVYPSVALQLVPFRDLAAKQKRLCQGTTAANFERSKVPIPVALRNLWTRIHPKPKLVQIRNADRAVTHAINQVSLDTVGKILPSLDLGHQPPKTIRPN